MNGTGKQWTRSYRRHLKDCPLLSFSTPRTRPTLKQQLQALLILLCVGGIIVGACIWFFGVFRPAVESAKEEYPPVGTPKVDRSKEEAAPFIYPR